MQWIPYNLQELRKKTDGIGLVMISPRDLFHKGRHMYCFRNYERTAFSRFRMQRGVRA